MSQQEIIKNALILDNLNFLNTICDERFGEIHLYNNVINKKEYVMGKDRFVFELDQLKKEIEKSQTLQIKSHANFLYLLDFSICKTKVYHKECFKITKYFEYSNRSLQSYMEKLKKEPNFQFKEEFIARLLYDIIEAIQFVDKNKLQCAIISPKNIIVEQQGFHSNKLIPIFNNKGYTHQFMKPNHNNGYYLSPKCFNFYSLGKDYHQTQKDLHFSLGLVVLEMCLEYSISKIYNPSFQSKLLIHMLKKFMRKFGRNHVFSKLLNCLLGINQTKDIEDYKQELIELINPEESSEQEEINTSSDDIKERSTNNSLSILSGNKKIDFLRNVQRNPLTLNFECSQPIIEEKYGLRISRQVSIDHKKSSEKQKSTQLKLLNIQNDKQKKFKEMYQQLKEKDSKQKLLITKQQNNFQSNKVLKCNILSLNQQSNKKNYNSGFFKPERVKVRRVDFKQLSNNFQSHKKLQKNFKTQIKKTTRISLLNDTNSNFQSLNNRTYKQLNYKFQFMFKNKFLYIKYLIIKYKQQVMMKQLSLKNSNDKTIRKFIEVKQKALRRSCTKENTSKSKRNFTQFTREENIQCKNFNIFFENKHSNIIKMSKNLQQMWQKQVEEINKLNQQVYKEKLVVKKIKRQKNIMMQKKKNLNQTLKSYQSEKQKLKNDIKKYQVQLYKSQQLSQEIRILFKNVQKIQHQLNLNEEISINFVDQLQNLQNQFTEISQKTQNLNLKNKINQLQEIISQQSSSVFFNKLQKQIDQKYLDFLSNKFQNLNSEIQEQNSQNPQSLYLQRNHRLGIVSNKYSDCIYNNNKKIKDDSEDNNLPNIFMDQTFQPTKSFGQNRQILNIQQRPIPNYYSSQTRKTLDKKLKRQLTDFTSNQQSAYFRNNSVNVKKKNTFTVLQQSNFADRKSLQEFQLLEINWKKIIKSFVLISNMIFDNSKTFAHIFLKQKFENNKEEEIKKFLIDLKHRQQNCKQQIEGYKKLKEVSIQGLNSCIKGLVASVKTEKFYQNDFIQALMGIEIQTY